MNVIDGIKLVMAGRNLRDKIILFYFVLRKALLIFSKKRSQHGIKLIATLPSIKLNIKNCLFETRENSRDLFYLTPSYEKEIGKEIEKIRNGVFIDIGSHIGRYALIVAKNTKCKVLAIEPEPQNYLSIIKNLSLNNLTNVKTYKLAISDKKGFAILRASNIIGCGEATLLKIHPFSKSGVSLLKKVRVKTETLDSLLKKERILPQDVSMVKIDVEGAEINVLKGAKKLLAMGRAKIIFEALTQGSYKKCSKILEAFGYSVKQIGEHDYIGIKN